MLEGATGLSLSMEENKSTIKVCDKMCHPLQV